MVLMNHAAARVKGGSPLFRKCRTRERETWLIGVEPGARNGHGSDSFDPATPRVASRRRHAGPDIYANAVPATRSVVRGDESLSRCRLHCARILHQVRPHQLAWFAGGIIPTNAMPHFIIGVSDSTFQTSLARQPSKRPGTGFAPSTINVPWGAVRLLVVWPLLGHAGGCDLRCATKAGVFELCRLPAATGLACGFSRIHGDVAPTQRSGMQ